MKTDLKLKSTNEDKHMYDEHMTSQRKSKQRVHFFQDSSNNNYNGQCELESSQENLKRYNKEITKLILRNYSKEPRNNVVIDFGAGNGQLASLVSKEGACTPICVEIDSVLSHELEKKGFLTFSSLKNTRIPKADFIYSSNVLEHIEDDETTLADLYNQLVTNGTISIFVPALPFLYSNFDYQVGHFRRYTKKDLYLKLANAGFIDISIRYFDSLGIITWLLMKMLRVRPSSKTGVSISMIIYDKMVFPCSRFFDKIGFSIFAGKNLVAYARKGS